MFDISSNGIIAVTRGDTFSFPLFLNVGTALTPARYVIQEKDEIYFGVCEPNQLFENAIIRKKYTSKDLNKSGDVVVEFFPQDTQHLLPGKYYYQVKLNQYNKDKDMYEVHTVVQKTQFFIEE